MAATAARQARLKVTGSPVAFTGEATTTADDRTYQITDATKRVWDPTATITVKDGGVATAEAYTLNRLAGKITFGTVDNTRVITVDGSSLPTSAVAEGSGFSLEATAEYVDDTELTDAQMVRAAQTVRDCSGTIDRFYSVDTYFADALDAGTPFVLELSLDAGVSLFARCWALLTKATVSAAAKGRIDEAVGFEGAADADGRSITFLQ